MPFSHTQVLSTQRPIEVQRGRVVSLGHSGGEAEGEERTHWMMGVHVPERWTVRLTDRGSNKQRDECGGQALKTRNTGQVACLLLPLPTAQPSRAQLCPNPHLAGPLGLIFHPTHTVWPLGFCLEQLNPAEHTALLPSLCLLTKSQTQGRECPMTLLIPRV